MLRLIIGFFSLIYCLSFSFLATAHSLRQRKIKNICSETLSKDRRHYFDHLPDSVPALRFLLDAEILLNDPRVKILTPRSKVFVLGSYINLRNPLEEALIQIGYPEPELSLHPTSSQEFFITKGNYRYRLERTIRNGEIFYWLVDVRFLEPTEQPLDRFHPPTREMATGHRLDSEAYLMRWLSFLRIELASRRPSIEISSEIKRSCTYTPESLSDLLFQALDKVPDPSSSKGLPLLLFDYSDPREELFYIRTGEPRNRQWLTFQRFYQDNSDRVSYQLISVTRRTPLAFRTGLGPQLISLAVEQRKSFWTQLFSSLSTTSNGSRLSPTSFDPHLPVQRTLTGTAQSVVEHIESVSSNSLDLNLLYEGLRTGGSGISGCHTLDCWEDLVRHLCLKNGASDSNGLFFFLGPQPPSKQQTFASPLSPERTVTLTFWDHPYFIRNYRQNGYSRSGVKTVFSLDGLTNSEFIHWITNVGIDFASRDPRPYRQGWNGRLVTVTPGLTIFFGYEQSHEKGLLLKTWYPVSITAER